MKHDIQLDVFFVCLSHTAKWSDLNAIPACCTVLVSFGAKKKNDSSWAAHSLLLANVNHCDADKLRRTSHDVNFVCSRCSTAHRKTSDVPWGPE